MKWKLNLSMFKKGTIWWVVGAIVLFVIFYMVASKGSGSSASSGGGGVTTVNSGPSDSQLAASVALQSATIQANAATTAANLEAQTRMAEYDANYRIAQIAGAGQVAEIQAAADVAKYTALKDSEVQAQYLTAQQNIVDLQGEYSLETARTAAQVEIHGIDAQTKMFADQMAANRAMYETQAKTLVQSALIQEAGGTDYRTRSHLLAQINATINNQALDYSSEGQHSFIAPTTSLVQ